MRRATAVGLVLMVVAGARGADTQPAGGIFRVVPQWKTGDAFHFDVVKTQTRTEAGMVTEDAKLRYIAEYKVVEAGPAGYVFEWYMTDLKLVAPVDPTGTAERAGMVFGKDSPMRFKVSLEGVPATRVENWDQVRAATLKSLDIALESRPEAARKEALDSITSMMDNPTYRPMLEASTLQEMTILFGLGREEFKMHAQPMVVDMQIPIGNWPTVSSTHTSELVSEDASQVVVRHFIEFSPEAVKAAAQGLNLGQGRDAKGKMTMRYEGTVARETGRVARLNYVQSVEVGDFKQDMTLEFRERPAATQGASGSADSGAK